MWTSAVKTTPIRREQTVGTVIGPKYATQLERFSDQPKTILQNSYSSPKRGLVNCSPQTSRKIANDYTRLRGQYYELARQAYIRGDLKMAKELSVKGKQADEMSKEAHAEASERIFSEMNTKVTPSSIDLHGLHVQEALQRVTSLLQNPSYLVVTIVVGEGLHSVKAKAKLKPAVIAYLKSNKYKFTVTEGAIRVKTRKNVQH
jgi:DNA-nicking Smr family endonuclease